MRRLGAAAAALALLVAAPAAGAVPPPLTVYVTGADTRTALRLQPGYATVVRADRRIDAVAIGDPRLVTATPVKHGQDVYDIILQPQVDVGSTNMVVWFGDVTSVWDLTIAPGPRTADVVYVVVRAAGGAVTPPSARAAAAPPPPSPAGAPAGQPPAAAPRSGPQANAQSAAPAAPGHAAAPAGGPNMLEVSQTAGSVAATFQITRTSDGVSIRYHVTNGGDADLVIKPAGVLVRVNGALVPYAMARASADHSRPDVLPHGATETGVIDASGATPRSVQLTLSFFPAAQNGQASGVVVPLTFEPVFSEVDRLPITAGS